MNAADWVGVLGGIGGIVGGIYGFIANRKADTANRHADKANAIATQSNSIAREASQLSNTANVISSESNRLASEANTIANEALDYQKHAGTSSSQAILVHRFLRPGSVIPWSRSGEAADLKIRLFNEGPAVARDVSLSLTFPDGRTIHSSVIHSIPVEREVTPEVSINKNDLGEEFDMVLGYWIKWRDGNGSKEMKIGIRIQGPWFSDWRTFIEDYPVYP